MPQLFAQITSMSLGDSFVISLLGIAIVFAVLIVLSLVIRLISAVVNAATKKVAASAPAAASAAPAAAPVPAGMVPAPGSLGEVKLHSVDDKTAAMIMAIVADGMDAPLNELRFLSIKEIEK